MPAYDETYLLDAMENVGAAADFATAALGLSLPTFWRIFASGEIGRGIENGMPWALVGLSGEEMALRTCSQAGVAAGDGGLLPPLRQQLAKAPALLGLSCEYWCGYSVTYLQWATGWSFSQIEQRLPMVQVAAMYPTFHEESEERFLEAGLEVMGRNCPVCGLKRQRELLGLSQSQLARASGVGIRAIQQYEQGAKRIDRASYDTVQKLAQALRCRPADILYAPTRSEYGVVPL